MELHLVDATYELFRAHHAPRPPVVGRDGVILSGVAGLVDQLCRLLGAEGATHVACATDRTVRSFRNERFAGYKTGDGLDPAILAQFPLAEAAIEALGIVLWPMTDFEADDALAAGAARFAADPRVARVLICSADKDLAQCVRGTRVVLRDRRRGVDHDEDGVRERWGVDPASIPDRLALVGDAADGIPGIPGFGERTAAALLARYGHLEAIPADGAAWEVPGLRGPERLAATLSERYADALLYRDLATLRTAADGVPIPELDADALRWQGTDRARWSAFCAELGLPRLVGRPPRWRS